MAFKMSQEFPTASLDIAEDFHILHGAYVYIWYSILKAKTYNWLPNTHTTSNNYKQKATGHVTSLANGHFTGSEAPFVCEIPTASSNIYIFLLTLDWLWVARRLCSNEGMFQAFALVWQTPQNGRLHKTGEPTIEAACTPQTVPGRHF